MFQEHPSRTNQKTDLAEWLNGLSLQQYIENFMKNGFESVKDLRLSRQDLVKIGIKDVAHRDKILSSLFDLDGSHC